MRTCIVQSVSLACTFRFQTRSNKVKQSCSSAHPSRRYTLAVSPVNCSAIDRVRGPSKSTNSTLCHLPSMSWPFTTGMLSLLPVMILSRCECALIGSWSAHSCHVPVQFSANKETPLKLQKCLSTA